MNHNYSLIIRKKSSFYCCNYFIFVMLSLFIKIELGIIYYYIKLAAVWIVGKY